MARPLWRGRAGRPITRPGTSLVKAAPTPVSVGERSGFGGQFFAPGPPLTPMAPGAAGRAFDYPFGVNLNYIPRQQPGIKNVSFELLRRMADPAQGGLDLVRVAIEKRKRQMKLQQWHVVPRDGTEPNERTKAAEAMLRKPDGFQTWRAWIGQLLEDHFVIDAPSVYIREDTQQNRLLFEIIDGASINLLIDYDGRRPMPPLDGYQQVIKGLPAVGYTVDQLGYYADNFRPGRIYGMSPVEQIVTFITLTLNRQLSVLDYFTAGTVPDMLIGVPDTWDATRIAQFQQMWDSVLSGQLDLRRKVQFIPGETKPYETKTEVLKGDFDEWYARVIAWAFDLSPETLVKQTNRATAETAKESAQEDGGEYTKVFVKGVMDDLLERAGGGDLEFAYKDEEISDAKTKAEVASIYTGGATLMTVEEGRAMIGLKPPTPAQKTELDAANAPAPDPFGAPPLGAGEVDGEDDNAADAVGDGPDTSADDAAKAARSRGGRSLPAVPTNPKLRAKTEKGIALIARRALRAQQKALLALVASFAKADGTELADLLAELARHPWDDSILGKLRAFLATATADRAVAALDSLADYIGGTDEAYARLLTQANETAVEYARSRAGNAVRGIDQASQQFLNELTSAAVEGGATNAELATMIKDAYAFSDERAMVIARTETAIADGAGRMIGYRESGVVTGKEWNPDAEACEICLENADAGVVPLDEVFPSGDDHEPAHPNCECSVLPVVDD